MPRAVSRQPSVANVARDSGLGLRASGFGPRWLSRSRVPSPESRVPFLQRSFTLVETAVSILIVSVMLAAVLNTVAAAGRGEALLAERARGLLLAQALLGEVLAQYYADPAYGPGSWGIGGDELTGNRSLFDDVDDYDGWTASPPQNKDGTTVPESTGYEQVVDVEWVDPNDLLTPVDAETGVKWIEVVINCQGRRVARLSAWRTQSWRDPAAVAGGGS